MEKDALLGELARAALTPIPGTKPLFIRHRSPQELATVQHTVNSAGGLKPKVEGFLHRAADKVFTPRVAGAMKGLASVGVNNPEIIPMQAAPIPGLTPAYLAGKRGLERLIEKVLPVAKHAFATSQYSYPLNPIIESQASHQPGFLAPNLQSVTQKKKQAAGAPTRGNFYMSSDLPAVNPPDLGRVIQKRSGASGMDEPNQGVDKVGDLDLAFDPAPTSKKTKVSGLGLQRFAKKNLSGIGEGVLIAGAAGGYALKKGLDAQKASKEKDGDMLPDYVTYNAGDFKKSKYSMPVEEMSKFVTELREKMAAGAGGIMGVSPTLGGAPQAAKSVGAPKMSGPGPSIAQQTKPKGPHFGSGIAGAFKGSIGGRGPQDLS
jgi:hypothetical protein